MRAIMMAIGLLLKVYRRHASPLHMSATRIRLAFQPQLGPAWFMARHLIKAEVIEHGMTEI
jgi:hypothetical protein